MINGWREDFNEGPYDYLAVRDGWEIFQNRAWLRDPFVLTSPSGKKTKHQSERAAKEYAYGHGCPRPSEERL